MVTINSLSVMSSMVRVWVQEVSQMVELVSVHRLLPQNSMLSVLVPSNDSKSSHEPQMDTSSPLMPQEMRDGQQQVVQVRIGLSQEMLSE